MNKSQRRRRKRSKKSLTIFKGKPKIYGNIMCFFILLHSRKIFWCFVIFMKINHKINHMATNMESHATKIGELWGNCRK